jgi:diguanylate cyclase (GGDEF)-like protein
VGVAHDITKQVAYENALQREIAKSEAVGQTLDTALSNMKQGLAMYDADSRLIICNDNYMKPFGLTKADTRPGMSLSEIAKLRIANGFYSKDGPEKYLANRLGIASVMAAGGEFEDLTELNDGRFIRAIGHTLPFGGCVVTTEDVTELKRSEARISYLARHDTLTGLANRASFKDEIERVASRLTRDGTPFNILMLDLDRFKTINDTLGHAAGDELLRQVAGRLSDTVRDTDVVARLGGVSLPSSRPARATTIWSSARSSSARRRVNSSIASSRWRASRSISTAEFANRAPASAWRWRRATAPIRTTCCARPTWRCTLQRPTAAIPIASSIRRCSP